jgi:hypothetical protein
MKQAADAVGALAPGRPSNLLRLLQLAEPVQEQLMAGDLDMGHARALLPTSSPAAPPSRPACPRRRARPASGVPCAPRRR